MSLVANSNRARKAREFIVKSGNGIRTDNDKLRLLYDSYFINLEIPKRMDLDDWMDENFVLPAESASEHGQWRTQRFPFLRKPAKKISPSSRCEEVGVCKGAQLGFTTLMVGWKLYIADQGLGPTLYIQPTKEALAEYSEQKLQPSIDACKAVQDKLGDKRPKHLSSTKHRKYFPGGYIALGSSNSAPTLRSKSIRNLGIDEEDGCSQDVANEGSSIYLAIRRTSNFPDSKIFRISTPVLKATSSIEPYCKAGTAERYLVPCPHCNEKLDKYDGFFEIDWDLIDYKLDPRNVKCVCPCCGCLIEEYNKTWMLDNGFWYRYNPTPLIEFEGDEKREDILVAIEKHGYHTLSKEEIDYLDNTSIPDDEELICTFFISSLYSPLGFYSWNKAASEWKSANARNDKLELKTFINTVLGRSWSEAEDEISYKGLERRKELYSPYGNFDIPFPGLVVTMGVDVQKDRLEAQVIATGFNDEIFTLDYKVFHGDTAIMGDEEYKYHGQLTCWGLLHEYLEKEFKHESGAMLSIDCTLVDCGYRSPYVFHFVKAHQHRRVFAVQGLDGWRKGFYRAPKNLNHQNAIVYDAMVDELKFKMYSILRNEQPGPNYIHFSRTCEYPGHYFKGIVCEEMKTKRAGGKDVYYWEKPPGVPNEALDTINYAYTAFLVLQVDLNTRHNKLVDYANKNGTDLVLTRIEKTKQDPDKKPGKKPGKVVEKKKKVLKRKKN